MRNVSDYILESNTKAILEEIDATLNVEQINESFKSSILMDFVKQIADNRAKETSGYNKQNLIFKAMFGQYNVNWAEVDDEDFRIVKAIRTDETDKKVIKERKSMEKEVRVVIKNEANAIVLLRNPKTGIFEYFYTPYGRLMSATSARRVQSSYYGKDEPTQAERMGYLDGRDIYYLSITKKISTTAIHDERRNIKQGVLDPRDNYSMKQLAEANIKRYKEIIAKRKLERSTKNDTIVAEVNELLQGSMQIASKYNENIVKYADLTYDVQYLLKRIYDQQVHTGFYKGKATYSGKYGLLYYFTEYLNSKSSGLKTTSDMADYYKRSMESARKNLEKIMEEIDGLIQQINVKMK